MKSGERNWIIKATFLFIQVVLLDIKDFFHHLDSRVEARKNTSLIF